MYTVEQAWSLSTTLLKKNNCFNTNLRYRYKMTWSRNKETMATIGFFISNRNMYLRFLYKATINATGESQRMDYKVDLLKTSCHYGGHRYWFQCPDCHKRVGVLYIYTSIYAKCQKCSKLTYASQNANRFERIMGSKGYEYMLDKELASIRITHYGGKLTKRYLRYLKRSDKSTAALYWAMARLRTGITKTKKPNSNCAFLPPWSSASQNKKGKS